jgi:GAF domain-containing protein
MTDAVTVEQLQAELRQSRAETAALREQQTATAEVLRIIASSPTELSAVLAAVAEHASRVCGAEDAHVRLLDGEQLRLVAAHGTVPGQGLGEAIPAGPGSVGGCAIIGRRTVHVRDVLAEPAGRFPTARSLAERYGFRAMLATPLLREGVPIGNVTPRRMEAEPFTDAQIRQLETFADQAVIAIENARLFQEV